MTKQIYIHVGAGKTGTSAIQMFMADNRDRLQDLGLHIPLVGANKDRRYLSHHSLSGLKKFDQGDALELWSQIAGTSAERVLVSSEVFHSLISNSGGEDFFESVHRILDAWQVFVIFYVRRQDEWLQSAYEQWLKAGQLRTGETITEVAERYSKNLIDQVRAFARVFGKDAMIVRPYEKPQLKNENAIDDFFSIFEIYPDQSYQWPDRNANPGLPRAAIELKRLFNSVCESEAQGRLLNRDIFAYQAMKAESDDNLFRSHDTLSDAQKAAILSPEVREGYRWMAREFLGRTGDLFLDMPDAASGAHTAENATRDHETEKEMLMFVLRRMYERMDRLEARLKSLQK